MEEGQRMTEKKGVEEFVGEQEDYGGHSRVERAPGSSSGDVLPGWWIEAPPELVSTCLEKPR